MDGAVNTVLSYTLSGDTLGDVLIPTDKTGHLHELRCMALSPSAELYIAHAYKRDSRILVNRPTHPSATMCTWAQSGAVASLLRQVYSRPNADGKRTFLRNLTTPDEDELCVHPCGVGA